MKDVCLYVRQRVCRAEMWFTESLVARDSHSKLERSRAGNEGQAAAGSALRKGSLPSEGEAVNKLTPPLIP